MNQRDLVTDFVETYSKRVSPRCEGFYPADVEDAIEEKFGRAKWSAMVCFGQRNFGDVLFNTGLLLEDIRWELGRRTRDDNGVRLRTYYSCDSAWTGAGFKRFKAIAYFTSGDFRNMEAAAETRRATALKLRNGASRAAEVMDELGVKFWKNVPAATRQEILYGIHGAKVPA